MRRLLFAILLTLLTGSVACNQQVAEVPAAASSETGVVTVFKSPT